MKYYSEILKKQFDTEKECLEAEEAIARKEKERGARKAEVTEALRNAVDLLGKYQDDYDEELTFEHGDSTFSIKPVRKGDFVDLFNLLF